jgi:putative transcriptional regulator
MKNHIKSGRARKNFTQEDLANLTGVTRQAIINIEKNNYNPSIELALKIAKALDTPIQELFELD